MYIYIYIYLHIYVYKYIHIRTCIYSLPDWTGNTWSDAEEEREKKNMSKREREGASAKKASKRVADEHEHKFVMHNLASASIEVCLMN